MARADLHFLIDHNEGLINNGKLLWLYDANSSGTKFFILEVRFGLVNTENNECLFKLRFEKEDLILLHDILQILN